MTTVVACVHPADQRPEVDPTTGAVRQDPGRIDLSITDRAALEHALRIGDAWGLPVVAVAAGPPSADAALREALGAGARTVRIPWPAAEPAEMLAGDPRPLAVALGAAIAPLTPAVVVCGDRSVTGGTGALPALLAHELGAAQALGLAALTVDGRRLVGERRLDGGRRERLAVAPPAVCSVEAAGVRLRRASLTAALDAARAAVEVAPAVAPAPGPRRLVPGPLRPFRPRTRVLPAPAGATARERLIELTGALVAHDPPRLVRPADADAAAAALLDYLRERGLATATGDVVPAS